MVHAKQHIADLAEICRIKGVARVIISPGSRSAPVIQAFLKAFPNDCLSIVDERSAAYFALGQAIALRKPVALICTSGTAVLNYAPALAEAYYQKVPLVAITADRAREWTDQQDNQTIRQNDIYHNYIISGCELPQLMHSTDDLWFAHRMINEALNNCMSQLPGPVHINVPIPEPLYDPLPDVSDNLRIINQSFPESKLILSEQLLKEWDNSENIMIIHGQDSPGAGVSPALEPLLLDSRVVVLAENIANIRHPQIIANSHLVLSVNREKNPPYPDLLLHSGGHIVSKSLSAYLRMAKNTKCWRIGIDHNLPDTYRHATAHITCPPHLFYQALSGHIRNDGVPVYPNLWHRLAKDAEKVADTRIGHIPFSEVSVFKKLALLVPANCNMVLGNSSVIRYSQLFPTVVPVLCYSNRGTSGIDGSLSTASGIAFASKKLTLAIVGDLGFLYDSNALWNRLLPENLRILVINNKGGGIFHILKGPSDQPGFKPFIEAHHPVNIAKLAEAYGLKYIFADHEQAFIARWDEFIASSNGPTIFEIKTDAAVSASSFRQLMAAT
jgi:2-succinyl-5-enolpyruvyl-6-hydroxy-3-cyclohexene-1-carboxylate synthase